MDESCPYRTVPPTRTQVPLAGSTNHEMNCKSDGALVTGHWVLVGYLTYLTYLFYYRIVVPGTG